MYQIVFLVFVILLAAFLGSLLNVSYEQFELLYPPAKTVLRGCEEEPLGKLECEKDYILKSAIMKYGRFDKDACPVKDEDKTKYQVLNRWTVYKSKPYDIPKEFLGKQVADFTKDGKPMIAFDIAKEDPMKSRNPKTIYKHFEIKGTCQKAFAKVSGCGENPLPKLTCPDGRVVDGATLKYGRWDDSCPDPYGYKVKGNNKPVSAEFTLHDKFLGKETVNWGDATVKSLADNRDPAPGIAKQFEITAHCVSKP
jgi:hypothetical protein